MKKLILALTLLIASPAMAQQDGVGTPPEKTQGTNVGAYIQWPYEYLDTAGMIMEPNGFIIYNAPTLAGFGTDKEIEIGLIDITKFQSPDDPNLFKYHIAGNPDLVGKDSCYKIQAYQTSVSGGQPIRLDSGLSPAICGRAVNTLATPKGLTIQ